MATKPFAIVLILFCTILTSFAQVFYKKASMSLSFNIIELIKNYNLIIGMLLYGLGAIIMIYSLKHGEVTVLYPIITLSYVWVSILSVYFFNEIMNSLKWTGVIFVVIGIMFIGLGSRNNKELKSGVSE